MHGDETQSVSLVEEMGRSFRLHPEHLKNVTVLLVKTPNPDGYFGHSPYNVHGIDLNRNFPSANWKELKNTRAGDRAASEAETQAVVRLLKDFHPGLLVHLKDSRKTSIVNYEGEIETSAKQIASLISCQVVQGLGEKTSGSVENYAQTQLACPSLTLLLSREASDEAAWARNQDALLALLEIAQSGQPDGGASRSIDDQPDPFEDPPVHKSSMRRQRPADQTNRSRSTPLEKPARRAPLPDFPAAVPDHGYLELPAP
jgi:protein MpaA